MLCAQIEHSPPAITKTHQRMTVWGSRGEGGEREGGVVGRGV